MSDDTYHVVFEENYFKGQIRQFTIERPEVGQLHTLPDDAAPGATWRVKALEKIGNSEMPKAVLVFHSGIRPPIPTVD